VMYSISFLNEGKYRVLSDSITLAFDPRKENLNIKIDKPVKSDDLVPIAISRIPPDKRKSDQYRDEDRLELRSIASRVKQDLTDLIDKDLVSVKEKDLWLEVEIKSSILFPSGSASPTGLAEPVLNKIAAILGSYDNQVQVEGFTDNVPITNEVYPSNWELSAARAASVVHLFTRAGVRPERLSAVGYGEYKPIASNSTEEGRGKNRRVNIIILSDSIARRSMSEKIPETVNNTN
ncbi:OmpA family protein, partial [Kaarinaea lacus]